MQKVSKNDLEIAACTIRAEKLKLGIAISHCQAQNEAAKNFGARNWQEALASCAATEEPRADHADGTKHVRASECAKQLPPLIAGYYSCADRAREEHCPPDPQYRGPDTRTLPGPQASQSDKILLQRARQRGELLAAASTPLYTYNLSGVPTEMYRLHSGIYEYRHRIIIHATWQPVVSGDQRGPLYIAAWEKSSDWREALDVWFANHGTAEALEDLLTDLDATQDVAQKHT